MVCALARVGRAEGSGAAVAEGNGWVSRLGGERGRVGWSVLVAAVGGGGGVCW